VTNLWKNPAHDTATYDAWNRLVLLNNGTNDVQVNAYDGNHRRIVRDETGGSSGKLERSARGPVGTRLNE
jgi:hypothetical protein